MLQCYFLLLVVAHPQLLTAHVFLTCSASFCSLLPPTSLDCCLPLPHSPSPSPPPHSFAAAHCPFVLVPNANHGQSSNGIPNYARGDIKAQLSDEEARASFAAAIGEFATAHEGGSPAARAAATSALLQRCRATAELMAPYFLASGACCV